MTAVSNEDFASDYTDCVFPSERAAGLWFQREASRHGTPLQIKTVWEANENEMRELKKFYDGCEVRFCVKVLIQEETVLKSMRGFIQPPRYEVLWLAAEFKLEKELTLLAKH